MNDGTYKEGEPRQKLTVDFVFVIKQNPGHEHHLHQLLATFLKGKGITLKEDKTVEV